MTVRRGTRTRPVRRLLASLGARLRERRLEWMFGRFEAAGSRAAAQRLVERHPVLTTTAADRLIGELADAADRIGAHDLAASHRYHQVLLRRCRAIGTVAAFRELTADETDAALVDLANRPVDALRRHEASGKAADLDAALRDAEEAARAVAVHDRAVSPTAARAPERVAALNNLAAALRLRAELEDDKEALRRAVETCA